jgi:hypothetical protein
MRCVADVIQESFEREFGMERTGFIENGDSQPVILTHFNNNQTCDDKVRAQFGCQSGDSMLLVGFQPSGETGLMPSRRMTLFPKRYRGLAVEYRHWPLG